MKLTQLWWLRCWGTRKLWKSPLRHYKLVQRKLQLFWFVKMVFSKLFVSCHVLFSMPDWKKPHMSKFFLSTWLHIHRRQTPEMFHCPSRAGKCSPASEIPSGKHGMVSPCECEPTDDSILFTPHDWLTQEFSILEGFPVVQISYLCNNI